MDKYEEYDYSIECLWFNTIALCKESLESTGFDLGPVTNLIEYKNYLSGDPIYWEEIIYVAGTDGGGDYAGGSIGHGIKQVYQPVSQLSKRTAHKWIIIHYSVSWQSPAGEAEKMVNTWKKRGGQVGADFGVDDGGVVQFNPDLNKYAGASIKGVGSTQGKDTRGNNWAKYRNECTNFNSISIEMCSTVDREWWSNNKSKCRTDGNGNPYPNTPPYSYSPAVLENGKRLVKYLMQKFHIDKDHIITHYLADGKLCPGIEGWNDGKWCYGKRSNGSDYNDMDRFEEFKNGCVTATPLDMNVAYGSDMQDSGGTRGGISPTGKLLSIASSLSGNEYAGAFTILPVYARSGDWFNCMNQCFPGYKPGQTDLLLGPTAMEMLKKSVKYLKQNWPDYKLVIWDAYRPFAASQWASTRVKPGGNNVTNSTDAKYIPPRGGNKTWFASGKNSWHPYGAAIDVGLMYKGTYVCMTGTFGNLWARNTGGMDDFKRPKALTSYDWSIYTKARDAGKWQTIKGEWWHWQTVKQNPDGIDGNTSY